MIFCDYRNNVLIIRPYLYRSALALANVLFLPLKLNISVYSGSFAYPASSLSWRDFAGLLLAFDHRLGFRFFSEIIGDAGKKIAV